MILAHIIQYANANTRTTLLNPSLTLLAQVLKTTGSSNVTLKNPSFAGIVEGFINTISSERNCINNGTPGATNASTTLNNILTIRNNTTYNSLDNMVTVSPDIISAYSASGTNAVIINVYLNPTFTTSLTYTNINATTSVISYSTTASAITSTGTPLFTFFVSPGTTDKINLSSQNVILNPGDVLAITARTISGTSTVYASISWKEQF